MKDHEFKQKLQEVFIVDPTDLGIGSLTGIYKLLVKRLKVAPFIVLVPLSFIAAFFVYLILGSPIVSLVTLLQNAF